jgi:hypothetical protein
MKLVRHLLVVIVMAIASLATAQSSAVPIYSQDFETAPVGQICCPQQGLSYTQGNVGGNDLIWDHTASGGAGGTKGLSILFDGTGRPGYIVAVGDIEPTASDANPLGNGIVTSPSHIRFSVDVKTIGNISPTPIKLRVAQTDPNYEADRGIYANSDGDMTDSATNFESTLTPTISMTSDYNHFSYTLDQGNLSAHINRTSPSAVIPLTPEFDPTVSLTWSIIFDYTGFGFDAGNIVSVDNILIEAVPEPAAWLLTSIVCSILCGRCRTR